LLSSDFLSCLTYGVAGLGLGFFAEFTDGVEVFVSDREVAVLNELWQGAVIFGFTNASFDQGRLISLLAQGGRDLVSNFWVDGIGNGDCVFWDGVRFHQGLQHGIVCESNLAVTGIQREQ